MDQFGWILWAVLGICFITAEVFTLGFVLLWFGIGAIVAALASFLGIGVTGQVLIFFLVSIVLTVMSRTIFDNVFNWGSDKEIKTGIDTLPGKVGTVRKSSKGALNAASVRVYGSNWKAFPVDGESVFEEGEKVEVVRVEGASIYVRKANKELRGWKDSD